MQKRNFTSQKTEEKMKIASLVLLGFLSFVARNASASSHAKSLELADVDYQFSPLKLNSANDSFLFYRSFVDYFYLLVKKNELNLSTASLKNTEGLCVGDAHAENFGFVIDNNLASMFTHNDLDDSGVCPLAYDYLRMSVSYYLYDNEAPLKEALKAYLTGLKRSFLTMPKPVEKMYLKSMEKSIAISEKKISNNKFIRKPEYQEVSPSDFKPIKNLVETNLATFNLTVLDIVATQKDSGGSAGLSRYEVLAKYKNDLIQLELKELAAPSIYPVSSKNAMSALDRISLALNYIHGVEYSRFYKVLSYQAKDFLLRPNKFPNFVGVELSKNSLKENREIIHYEFYVLGLIHSSTMSPNYYDAMLKNEKLKDDIEVFGKFFKTKFEELKK